MANLTNARNNLLSSSPVRITGAAVSINAGVLTSIIFPNNQSPVLPVPSNATLTALATGYITPQYAWSYRFGNTASFTGLSSTSSTLDFSFDNKFYLLAEDKPVSDKNLVQFKVTVTDTAGNVGLNQSEYILSVPILREATNYAKVTLYNRTATATAPALDTANNFTYNFTDANIVGQPAGWYTSPPDESGGGYLWITVASVAALEPSKSFANSLWSTPVLYTRSGTSGTSTALVYAYKRSVDQPVTTDRPGDVVFDFSTGKITTATLLNSWEKTLPTNKADGKSTWVTVATASNTTTTDNIGNSEWSTPVKFVANGLNTATVFLYARNNSTATVPEVSSTGSTTYTFSTALLSSTSPNVIPSGWSQTLPLDSSGSVLWVIQATASSTADTDTISNTEWSDPRVLSVKGASGDPGLPGAPGSPGVRGTKQLYAASTAYNSSYQYNVSTAKGPTSYAVKATELIATAATGTIPTTPLAGDTVTFSNSVTSTYVGTISDYILRVSSVSSGTVQINQTISGNGILAGTTIVAFIDGTEGGAGRYSLSRSQTVSSSTDITATLGDYVYTITYDGTAWKPPGTVIDGSLLVTNSITASKINSNGLSIKDADGKIILAAGTALDYSRVGGTKPPSNATNGAPSGTLVAGVPADSLAVVYKDFNTSNNQNGSPIVPPSFNSDSLTIDHTLRKDGSVDISVEWIWPSMASGYGTIIGSILNITSTSLGSYQAGQSIRAAFITGFPVGLYIVSQLTGTTGGVGTYQLNASLTEDLTTSSYIVGEVSSSFIGTISGTTLNVTSNTRGLLKIGQSLSGTGITAGTYIKKFISGTGLTGTYEVSISHSITNNTTITGSMVEGDIDGFEITVRDDDTYDASFSPSLYGLDLTNNYIYCAYAHGFVTGQTVKYKIGTISTDTALEGLINNSIYYAIASTEADVSFVGEITGNILTVSNISTGTVDIGKSIVVGSSSSAAAFIIDRGTGTGGIGTYILNRTVTTNIPSQTLVATTKYRLQIASNMGNAISGTAIDLTSYPSNPSLYHYLNGGKYRTIGSSVTNETTYQVPANKRAFILYGVAADLAYTFGIAAYRSVNRTVASGGVIKSVIAQPTYGSDNPYIPTREVAFSGNITGTVNNIPAASVNVWSSISGAGKPENDATKGATFGNASTQTNITGKITSTNISTFIENLAVNRIQVQDNAITVSGSAEGLSSVSISPNSTYTYGGALVTTPKIKVYSGEVVTVLISFCIDYSWDCRYRCAPQSAIRVHSYTKSASGVYTQDSTRIGSFSIFPFIRNPVAFDTVSATQTVTISRIVTYQNNSGIDKYIDAEYGYVNTSLSTSYVVNSSLGEINVSFK